MAMLIVLLSVAQMSSISTQTPQFAPGEVLVRFAAGTSASEAVSLAARAEPANLGELRAVTVGLSERAGVPLRATSLSSGGWVVLVVNREELARSLARRAGSRTGVMFAEAMTTQAAEGIGGLPSPGIRVRFVSGSPEAAAVKANVAGAERGCLMQVAHGFERDLGVRFAAEALAPDTLLLRVDLTALTLSLVTRLKEMPEVAEAQPNYILKRFGP
jgi:hypothetical protein